MLKNRLLYYKIFQSRIKKLVSVLVISSSMILTSMDAIPRLITCFAFMSSNTDTLSLERMHYIYYLVQFQNDQAKVSVLIDFESELNIKTPAYVSKLDLQV